MISKIYNTNDILFKSGERLGNSKKDIQFEIDGSKKNISIKKLKTKKKKIKNFNENTIDMYAKRREKRRNERDK